PGFGPVFTVCESIGVRCRSPPDRWTDRLRLWLAPGTGIGHVGVRFIAGAHCSRLPVVGATQLYRCRHLCGIVPPRYRTDREYHEDSTLIARQLQIFRSDPFGVM